MQSLSRWVVGLFTSPVGVVVLAALDSTIFFSLPFGIDAAVIILAARLRSLAWIVPVLATLGATAGAAITYWMGMMIGEKGLDRYASPRRVNRIRNRVRKSGAIALAVLDLIPPPFPFTLFVLAAGALEVNASTFFVTLAVCRLVRFGTEAALAVVYGSSILAWVDSDIVHDIVAGSIVFALLLTVVSVIRLIRATRRPARKRPATA